MIAWKRRIKEKGTERRTPNSTRGQEIDPATEEEEEGSDDE